MPRFELKIFYHAQIQKDLKLNEKNNQQMHVSS